VSQTWPEIVDAYNELVVRSIRQIVGNDHDAEDTAQEVFLEAYRVASTIEVENWGGFLRRLATRRALDRLRAVRRAKMELEGIDLGGLPDAAFEPYQHATAHELSERLRNALAVLTPGQADVFALRYFDELSYEEIAETLKITANAVGLALNKARMRLQELLAD
jgi:RNA polymerase sigma-70 factor (ECF subfamily)